MPQTICSSPSSDRALQIQFEGEIYCQGVLWDCVQDGSSKTCFIIRVSVSLIGTSGPAETFGYEFTYNKALQNNKKLLVLSRNILIKALVVFTVASLDFLRAEDTLSEVQTSSSILLRCTITVHFYDEQQPIYGISAPQKQINPAAQNLIAELHHFYSTELHFHRVRALNWMRLLIKWQKLIRTVCCHLHVRNCDLLLSQTRGRFISKL